jgi:hypothetical protein
MGLYMSCFLYVDDKEAERKINIDELYEKKHQRDLRQLTIFNKILNRIHKRITHTGRMKQNDKHIWFTIPPYIFGEPTYDKGDCIAFIITRLEENGFFVKYIHPNTILVSWENWIPTYARNEFKKKTGIAVDEKGNIIEQKENEKGEEEEETGITRTVQTSKKDGSKYTPIEKYKPTGNLVYSPDILEKIEKKFT